MANSVTKKQSISNSSENHDMASPHHIIPNPVLATAENQVPGDYEKFPKLLMEHTDSPELLTKLGGSI